MTTDIRFNGYMITFHCNHCGKNFIVAWYNNKGTPKYSTCLYCQVPYGATPIYLAEKERVIII